MVVKAQRIAAQIHRELPMIINSIIKNDIIKYINVVEVRMSKDLSIATIYYTILQEDERTIEYSKTLIKDKQDLIRRELAKKMNYLRKVPQLVFKFDTALAYGNKIDQLLKQINEK